MLTNKQHLNKLSIVIIDSLIAIAYASCKALKEDNSSLNAEKFKTFYNEALNYIIENSAMYK